MLKVSIVFHDVWQVIAVGTIVAVWNPFIAWNAFVLLIQIADPPLRCFKPRDQWKMIWAELWRTRPAPEFVHYVLGFLREIQNSHSLQTNSSEIDVILRAASYQGHHGFLALRNKSFA